MANIGTTDFYIDIPSLSRKKFEKYSVSLFDDWESYVKTTLILPDYYLLLNVEEGSLKASAKIYAAVGIIYAVYIGVGNYGQFFSGVKTAESHVRYINNYVGERAGAPFKSSGVKPKVRKQGESLTKLRNLFEKVQHGEITVEQAMSSAKIILGPEIDTAPEFMVDLEKALEQTPMQIKFPFMLEYGESSTSLSKKINKMPPKKPKEPAPDPKYYMKVWRESRTGKRNVQFVKL